MSTRVRAERIPTSQGVRYWLDETCWAELPGLDRRLDERLDGADGWAPQPRLERGLSPDEKERFTGLLELFTSTGLAVDGSPDSPLAGIRVGVTGSGSLARSLAQALLRAGVRQLDCLDPLPPDPLVWPASRHTTGGAALAQALRPRQAVGVSSVGTVRELADRGVDVVLVAGATVEADRLLLDELVRHDLVHLVLGCHRELSRIGPLVQPGRTPCMRCHDLGRTATDPAWAQVLAHLSRLPARPQPTLALQVVSRAVLELGWLARGMDAAPRLSGRIELCDLHYPEPREVRFALQPECSCGWLV